MSVLIAGSVALDDLKTPFGEKKNILGGSAVHASVSASFFTPVDLVGVVGKDFPKEHIDFLESRRIGLDGLKITDGKTFHWDGYYEFDMNEAHTIKTDLNVLADFDPVLNDRQKNSDFVFLANLTPGTQLNIISQLKKPKLIMADTMNFWIEHSRQQLIEVVKKTDIMLLNESEARQLMGTPNLITAAKELIKLGAKCVIIKKGEHGALLFTKTLHFSAPSFPQENLTDPTGAGDSFAGGVIGYLAKSDDLSDLNIKRAVIIGSVMASFNVEDFSLDRLRRLSEREITERYEMIRKYSIFDCLP